MTSTDGRESSEAPDQPAFQGANVDGAVAVGPEFAAIGHDRFDSTGGFVLWTSIDGTTWVRVEGPAGRDVNPVGIASDGQRVVILACGAQGCETWGSAIGG
jgi:hypothetical protein